MIDFVAIYMSLEERNRIGHDIIDIMPSRADIATIKLDNLLLVIINWVTVDKTFI
jgi:hypothetical protein